MKCNSSMKLTHLYMAERSMISWCYSYPLEWDTRIWTVSLTLATNSACLAVL